ncbi:MAG: MraY family glycosyltransferase [Candidatus Hydrogenedentota bacterium]
MIYIIISILNFFISLILTNIFIKTFYKYRILDIPDDKLKTHKKPVPTIGGLSFIITFLVTIIYLFINLKLKDERTTNYFNALLYSGIYITIIGIIDDIKHLKAITKLILELVIIFVIIIKIDIRMRLVMFPYWLNIVLSIFWLIGVINSINIIDIMDGLAAGVSVIIAITFSLLGILSDNYFLSITAIFLALSLLGFLTYNYRDAKIYMGNTGSLFLGVVFGIMSLEMSYTKVNDLGFFIPLLILGIPLYDTIYVIILRFSQGKSILLGSPDHLGLRMLKSGMDKNTIVNLFYLLETGFGLLALCIVQVNRFTALGIYLFLIIVSFYIGYILNKVKM